MLPPMSDRFYIFIASMSQASRTVLIIWMLAQLTLIARWSIRYVPERFRALAFNAFDVWLIAINLYLFITA